MNDWPSEFVGAAHVLHCLKLTADFIYVDGDHDYLPAKNDLIAYWPLLRPGGILFGDDYSANWPGVQLAVQELCEAEKIQMKLKEVTWSIRKPIKWLFFQFFDRENMHISFHVIVPYMLDFKKLFDC